jgi:hypothetical protein
MTTLDYANRLTIAWELLMIATVLKSKWICWWLPVYSLSSPEYC